MFRDSHFTFRAELACIGRTGSFGRIHSLTINQKTKTSSIIRTSYICPENCSMRVFLDEMLSRRTRTSRGRHGTTLRTQVPISPTPTLTHCLSRSLRLDHLKLKPRLPPKGVKARICRARKTCAGSGLSDVALLAPSG